MKEHKSIQVDKLFERFYTTDRARRDSKGLALRIAKKLMKRMKGELTATVVGEEFIVTCKWKLVD